MFGIDWYGSLKNYIYIRVTIFHYDAILEIYEPKFKKQLAIAFDLADATKSREDYEKAKMVFEALDTKSSCHQLTRLSMLLRRKERAYPKN